MTTSKRITLALTLLLCTQAPAFAQEDMEAEMRELFGKVERRLREIDELLSDASSGDASGLRSVGESGIDKLLERSRKNGGEVIDAIDRILEIAQSQQSQPGSGQGSQGEPQPQPGSEPGPLDKQGQQTTPRESTPSSPQEQKPGEQGQEQPGGDKPEPQPNESRQPPKNPDGPPDPHRENFAGADPLQSATEDPASSLESGDRWGSLPRHAQDVFRSEGGLELPAEYRDWIDAYYRRLNRDDR